MNIALGDGRRPAFEKMADARDELHPRGGGASALIAMVAFAGPATRDTCLFRGRDGLVARGNRQGTRINIE